MVMNKQSQALQIQGPAGVLEVLRDVPTPELDLDRPPTYPRGTVVIAHPHPLFGGNMNHKVVQTLARAFNSQAWTAIRFNFRGVGHSQGSYDEGRGEVQDMLAVIEQLAGTGPLAIAGFSFGGHVCVQAGLALDVQQHLVHTQVLVGLAASRFAVPALLPHWHERTLIVHALDDEVVPIEAVWDWARPQGLGVCVPTVGGHFFHGQQVLLKHTVVKHLRSL
jgi:alpha/beta superfamily hydrolase